MSMFRYYLRKYSPWMDTNGKLHPIRYIFKLCLDCGVKLPKRYSRGEVCEKCFDEFNGMKASELVESLRDDPDYTEEKQ